MGLFRVPARLTGPTGHSEQVELLVDSGATLLVVPRDLADRLGVVPRRQQPVVIAGGKREVWPVAEVGLDLDGQEVTTPCFVAPGGPPLLGAVALESLFLAIDPVAKRLVPVEGFYRIPDPVITFVTASPAPRWVRGSRSSYPSAKEPL